MNCAEKPEGLVEPIGRHWRRWPCTCGDTGTKLPNQRRRRNGETVPERSAEWGAAISRRCWPRSSIAKIGGNDVGTAASGIVILSAPPMAKMVQPMRPGHLSIGKFNEAQRAGSIRPISWRNDAYHFFEPLGALIKTGPTNTNVCDVRVV